MKENDHPILIYCIAAVMLAGLILYVLLPSTTGHPERTDVHLAKVDISNLIVALDQFQVEFGDFPQGTNATVLKRLLGENSGNIRFFNVDSKRVNSLGEFIDPWNTSYQIRVFGKTNFTIRSAGPNHKFGDEDDLTNSRP